MCIQTCYVADSEVGARHHHAIHSSSIAYTVAAFLPAWKHHWVKQQHDISMRWPQFANNMLNKEPTDWQHLLSSPAD
jgi:hypothetical protein